MTRFAKSIFGPRLLSRLRAAVFALLASGGFVARAQEPVNKMCPVMTLEEIDPAIRTEYQGMIVAFCCDTCLKKFQANPERYAGQLDVYRTAEAQTVNKHDLRDEASDNEPDHNSGEGRMPFLARLHPAVVHVPLASAPLTVIALLAWLSSHKRMFAEADVPPLLLGAASSTLAVVTGNMAHDFMRFSDALHNYVHWHQYSATALMILLVILSALRLWRWRRLEGRWLTLYSSGLVIALGLVAVVGFLGGSLVFGPDHLWP